MFASMTADSLYLDYAATTPLLQVDVDPEKAAAAGMTQRRSGKPLQRFRRTRTA